MPHSPPSPILEVKLVPFVHRCCRISCCHTVFLNMSRTHEFILTIPTGSQVISESLSPVCCLLISTFSTSWNVFSFFGDFLLLVLLWSPLLNKLHQPSKQRKDFLGKRMHLILHKSALLLPSNKGMDFISVLMQRNSPRTVVNATQPIFINHQANVPGNWWL